MMFFTHHSAILPSMSTFGQRIRAQRENVKGWSQTELADEIGCTANYISRVERDADAPSNVFITKLANALGMTREHLGSPEPSAKRGADPAPSGEANRYPARVPLLKDKEFINAPRTVKDRVLGWPDAGADWTTRQWYALFEQSLALHGTKQTDARKDPRSKPARKRER